MCDVGLFLPFSHELFERAIYTPLPKPTIEEYLYYIQNDELENNPEDDGSFGDGACDIDDGVALTEEAAELGMADVVSHMQQTSLGQTPYIMD